MIELTLGCKVFTAPSKDEFAYIPNPSPERYTVVAFDDEMACVLRDGRSERLTFFRRDELFADLGSAHERMREAEREFRDEKDAKTQAECKLLNEAAAERAKFTAYALGRRSY